MPNLPGEILKVSDPNNYLIPDIITIIIFINSGCDHCKHEAKAIQQKLSSFAGANLLFISEEPKEDIVAFSQEYQLHNKEGIWWLKMQPEDVYKNFGNISIPHILIYSKEGLLLKEYKGVTKVDALLEYL